MYDATRPAYGEEGDARLKAQVAKITKARAAFRYPSTDPDGNRAMRMEAVIGWRDFKYPGYVAYDQAVSRESIPFDAASATLDPVLVGCAQQMLEHNQYFSQVKGVMENKGIKTTLALLDVPHTYETILTQPKQMTRLPMTVGQPDFVFDDPGTGALALKNGDEILYVSLYWRSRYTINNLARIHFMTPLIERSATAYQETRFNDSGLTYQMEDHVNAPFSGKFERDYKDGGLGGTELHIAKVPDTVEDYSPGKENIYAGKGDFYLLEYGNYLIAMNCTENTPQEFGVPVSFNGSLDLVSGKSIASGKMVVAPLKTMVLFRGNK